MTTTVEGQTPTRRRSCLVLVVISIALLHLLLDSRYLCKILLDPLTTAIDQNYTIVTDIITTNETLEHPNSTLGHPISTPWPDIHPRSLSAVFVDIRDHPAFSLVMENAVENLELNVKIYVWHTKENGPSLRNATQSSPVLRSHGDRIVFREFEPTKFGLTSGVSTWDGKYWYSSLLTSLEFWDSFPTTHVLTIQADTLLCRPLRNDVELAELGNIPFLGGLAAFRITVAKGTSLRMFKQEYLIPSLEGPAVQSYVTQQTNGGFSLRNVEFMKYCVKKYGAWTEWGDDTLYAYCLDKSSPIRPTEKQAYAFSSDNGWTGCFNDEDGKRICPLGVHKVWRKRNVKPEMYNEMVESCPGLSRLDSLHAKKK